MTLFPYPSMRGRFDLRHYLVLGPDDTKGRPVADVVAAALRGGATLVQLRAKHADSRDITAMARDIARVIAGQGRSDDVAFVIDDRVDAAWQCRSLGIKVDGVHIGQDDLDPEQTRSLLGPDAIVGLSAKTIGQIEAANALDDGVIDYIGVGPVHRTATKPEAAVVGADGVERALGVAGAGELCAASRYPVVVGGGVHADDVPELARTQAAGWFVVSAIAGADDPQAATRELVEAWTAVRGDRRHGHAPTARRHALPAVLTIAGSDSSGGAGIQADLKTMLANGVFGMSAITALTAQNTTGVRSVQDTDPAILADQIDAVFEDIRPDAVKIGMVSSAALIAVIADRLARHRAGNVVLDPVMVATSGARLIGEDAVGALTSMLFPLADVITPNIPEAEALLGMAFGSIDGAPAMREAAVALAERYGCAALVKGGHGTADASDVLAEPGGAVTWFDGVRVDNPNTHGTGCTLSSAIAANLAKGAALPQAISDAKTYLTGALGVQLDLGRGCGPMDHAWRWR